MPSVTYLPAEILDYVNTHAPGEESSFGISQSELATALGYHRCSMSRPIADLVQHGLLQTKRGTVRGGVRKQLVYSLTEEGRTQLRKVAGTAPLVSGVIPAQPVPFVGRKEELGQLFEATSAGLAIVHVQGPSGIGKTALVARHVRRLKEGVVPFWFSARPGSSPKHFTAALAHALSPLGAQQLAYYAQLPKLPAGREVADLAERALGARKLLAVVDDAHLADSEMRKFLSEFMTGFRDPRRDTFVLVGQDPVPWTPSGIEVKHVIVGGLDRSAAHDLTDRHGGLGERFEEIYKTSLGSPLLLRLAVSNPMRDTSAASLPAALVDHLQPRDRLDLLPLALANEPLPRALVMQASKLTDTDLDRFLRSGMLQAASDQRIELLQVVRDEFLKRVSGPDRRDAHRKLASYYTRSHRPEAIRERFIHLVAAEDWKSANQVIVRSERLLLSLGYNDGLRNALRHMTLSMPRGVGRVRALRVEARLLQVHSELPSALAALRRAISEAVQDPRLRCELLVQSADILVRLQQTDEASEALKEAEKKGPPSKRFRLSAQLARGRILEAQGDRDEAERLYASAFNDAKRSRLSELMLESAHAWSRLTLGGEPQGALRMVDDAIPAARKSSRVDLLFALKILRSRLLGVLGDVQGAFVELDQVRREADALGYLQPLVNALVGLSGFAFDAERWEDGTQYGRQALELAERVGNDSMLGHCLATLCSGEHRQAASVPQGEGRGRLLEDAMNHGERSVAILGALPSSDSLAMACGYLAEVYESMGRPDDAEQNFRRSLGIAKEVNMVWWITLVEREIERLASSRGSSAAMRSPTVATEVAGRT
ncbi:MAG: AAA family ATPase [Thermoplasmata archaeon]